MYSLTIHFGPNAAMWAFLFKNKERAEQNFELVSNIAGDEIVDDFGQRGFFKEQTIHAILLEDLEVTEEARIVRSLAEARVRVKLEQRAKTDPVIRQAQTQQGPGVLTPVPSFR